MQEVTGLFDPMALGIVLMGTILATYAREGGQDVAAAIASAFKLGRKGFDAGATRSALARTVGEIKRLGHLGAHPIDPPDNATTKLLNAYIRSGSIEAMLKLAQLQRMKRDIQSVAATRVYETAGELAPVFGLVGTLIAITQLMPDMESSAADIVMASVASAVLSSLYGVLSANLLFFPLARAIERRGDQEEAERNLILEWFENELIDGRQSPAPRPANLKNMRGAA
ncbi:MAG: MotA/TolQ/ExbB proton channel family protein [Erythrobacter sp.]|uniref:MotA/TolQ/ExbB proton channel family protein n=1 Tax=Erythrobacter sp. TaxID=1042 RepID=UPI003263AB48